MPSSLGKLGEQYAAAYLDQLGYRLVAANFTLPVGRNLRGAVVNAEIDLVAYDGDTLCFIEVKTRASDWFAPPQVNVDLQAPPNHARRSRVSSDARHRRRTAPLRRRYRRAQRRFNPTDRTPAKLLDRTIVPQASDVAGHGLYGMKSGFYPCNPWLILRFGLFSAWRGVLHVFIEPVDHLVKHVFDTLAPRVTMRLVRQHHQPHRRATSLQRLVHAF